MVDAVAGAMSEIPLGDHNDPASLFGPVVSERQRERVEPYLERGRQEGAKAVVGGGRPSAFPRGIYVEPTVFWNVTNDMRIALGEIFGPVLVVIPYEDDEEAIVIANESEYGLGGGAFSPDRERATEGARLIVTGATGVNSASFPMEAPFGGVKDSGMSRELGAGSLEPYLELKTIFRSVTGERLYLDVQANDDVCDRGGGRNAAALMTKSPVRSTAQRRYPEAAARQQAVGGLGVLRGRCVEAERHDVVPSSGG